MIGTALKVRQLVWIYMAAAAAALAVFSLALSIIDGCVRKTPHLGKQMERCVIFDRAGRPLAINQACFEIFADPSILEDPSMQEKVAALAEEHLGTDRERMLARMRAASVQSNIRPDPSPCRYVLLARFASLEKTEKFKKALGKMNYGKGICFRNNTRRVYPYGQILSNVLGLVSLDDEKRGLFGLESLVYRQRQKKGGPEALFLTIDMPIQEIVEDSVSALGSQFSPRHIYAIIAAPGNGNILAMAQHPNFDPGRRDYLEPYATRNFNLENQFWPGTMFTPLAIALSLDCAADGDAGSIARQSAKKQFFDRLASLGIGQSCGLPLRPEAVYRLHPAEKFDDLSIARCVGGYAFKLTPAQLVRAYCAVADGHLRKLRLIDSVKVIEDSKVRKLPVPNSTAEVTCSEARRDALGTFGLRTTQSGSEYLVKSAAWTLDDPYLDRWIAATIGLVPACKPEIVLLLAMETGSPAGGEVITTEAEVDHIITRISEKRKEGTVNGNK